jgi:methyl-accepting chemotaxis protein
VREIIFVIIATVILGVLLWLSYISKQKRFPTMFAVALLSLLAYYLFQYGNLSSFSLKALSAEASFIREKKQEAAQDAEAINAIRGQIGKLLVDSQESQQSIERAKTEILSIKKQIEEEAKRQRQSIEGLTEQMTQAQKNADQAKQELSQVASNLVKMAYVIALGAQGTGGPTEEHMKMMAEYAKAIEQLNPNMREELKKEFEKSGLNRRDWPQLPF